VKSSIEKPKNLYVVKGSPTGTKKNGKDVKERNKSTRGNAKKKAGARST